MVIKGAYYASWGSLNLSTIIPQLFTHIFYAFINPNNVTFQFNIGDTEAKKLEAFNRTLHKSPIKTLFSVGGGRSDSELFANMAANPSNRKTFIMSSIQVARKFGFDGIDLDWEYPRTPVDMRNLGLLLDEWRVEVQREAASTRRTPLLLTAAVYYKPRIVFDGTPREYPSASVGKNLDWINLMNYDYRGSWDNVTGHQAPLHDPSRRNYVSTCDGIWSWIESGVKESKLVMGLPLFGRTWKLRDPAEHGIGAAAIGAGPGTDGMMTYAKIVQFNRERNATRVYDPSSVSVYSFVGDSWITYDDKETVKAKILYAKDIAIGGYFFWELDGDYQWEISTTASANWPA